MEVPVPRVPHDARPQPQLAHPVTGDRDRGGQLRDGHAHVGVLVLGARHGVLHGVGDVVARLPEARPRGGVTLGVEGDCALRLGDRAHELDVRLDGAGVACGLDEQAGGLGEGGALVGVDGGNGGGVDELEPGDGRSGGDGSRGGAAGGLERGEGDTQRDGCVGQAVEAERQLRDHGERALRPDEQSREVVAGGRLGGPAAGADDTAAGEHGLEGEHVGAHLPVARRRRAGGVRRRHAADRGVCARVDGEEEPVLAGGAVQLHPGDAGLRDGGEVAGGERQDPVHPGEIERDAALDRDHVPLEARARGERRDGDAALVGERQHACDFLRRGGVDDEVGPVRVVERQVGGVQVALGVAGADAVGIGDDGRDGLVELAGECAHGNESARAGEGRAPQATAVTDPPSRAMVDGAPASYAETCGEAPAGRGRCRRERGNTTDSSVPFSGSGRAVRILGRGLREIDRQLLYSAAWLDDPRPGAEGPARVHVLRRRPVKGPYPTPSSGGRPGSD